jgi:hypothetical protein
MPDPAPSFAPLSPPAAPRSPWRRRIVVAACTAVSAGLIAYWAFALRPQTQQARARLSNAIESRTHSEAAERELRDAFDAYANLVAWEAAVPAIAYALLVTASLVAILGGAVERRRRRKEAQAARKPI